MKKVLKSFMALSLGLALVAAGCSKDDGESGVAKDIVGNYTGNILLSGTQVASNVTIAVTAKNENTVQLALNTTLAGLPVVGDLPLNVSLDASVVKSGDTYTVAGNTTVSIPTLGPVPMPLSITGTITAAGAAALDITITIGLPVTVNFAGTKN